MKDEKVILDITGTGMNGEGVARLSDLAVFIDGALLGERVEAVIFERKKNFARAKIIKIINKSPNRCEPICKVYYRCGGCNLQHISYNEQLQIKKSEIVSCLKKQLKYDVKVEDVIPSLTPFGYRNKLQLPIGELNGRIIAGFYRDNTHIIVQIDSCPLHGDWADKVIKAFLEYANALKISAYNELQHRGLLRHLVARKVGESVSIVIVINGYSIPNTEVLIDNLKRELDGNFTLHYSTNRERTNFIMGNNIHTIYGEERIVTDILGLKVQVSPLSFMQINDYIRDLIYRRVVELVGSERIVIDAYSGAGVLTALLAGKAKRAIGIEIVPEAVADADILMRENGLSDKVINICGDTVDILPKVYKELNSSVTTENIPTTLILDPPRKGCEPAVIETILKVKPSEIIYISCNPATLSRDLALLTADNAYTINSITPYDMFPETRHIEVLCFIVRK